MNVQRLRMEHAVSSTSLSTVRVMGLFFDCQSTSDGYNACIWTRQDGSRLITKSMHSKVDAMV